MSDHQADYPIATMCRVLGVSSSGYHAWVKRRPSRRAETDAVLIAAIRVAHTASRGTYGAPRCMPTCRAKGISVGCKRVARLMTQAGLAGVSRRKFVVTTVKDGGRQAPDRPSLPSHRCNGRPHQRWALHQDCGLRRLAATLALTFVRWRNLSMSGRLAHAAQRPVLQKGGH